MDYLRACGRTYSTSAGYVKSFIAVARFVRATRVARAPQGAVVSNKPVDDMRHAHKQGAGRCEGVPHACRGLQGFHGFFRSQSPGARRFFLFF